MEEVINQLAQSTLLKIFKDDIPSEFIEEDSGSAKNCNDNEVFRDTVVTSRDYLAKLLFWLVNSPVFLLGVYHIWKSKVDKYFTSKYTKYLYHKLNLLFLLTGVWYWAII